MIQIKLEIFLVWPPGSGKNRLLLHIHPCHSPTMAILLIEAIFISRRAQVRTQRRVLSGN